MSAACASENRSHVFFHAPCRIQIDSSAGQRLLDEELEIGVPRDQEHLALHVQSYTFRGASSRQILVFQNASTGTGERVDSRFLAWAPGEKAPRFFAGENQGLEQTPGYQYHYGRHDHLAISGAEAPWLETVAELQWKNGRWEEVDRTLATLAGSVSFRENWIDTLSGVRARVAEALAGPEPDREDMRRERERRRRYLNELDAFLDALKRNDRRLFTRLYENFGAWDRE